MNAKLPISLLGGGKKSFTHCLSIHNRIPSRKLKFSHANYGRKENHT
jgi:hypothetical protein